MDRSWRPDSQSNALVWADGIGNLYRKEINGAPLQTWGSVDFQVQEIHICHGKMVAICGTHGQLQFVPWQSEGWKPGFAFVTPSKMIRHGLILRTMKDQFFTVDDKSIYSYNYKSGIKSLIETHMDSSIIQAIEQPSSNNTIIALVSGEAVGQNMLNRILVLKSLHTWMKIRVASKAFLLACHDDSNSMACLDASGNLTTRNLDKPETVNSHRKIDLKFEDIKLLNLFYKGRTDKIVAHWKSDSATMACLIDNNTSIPPIQLEAHAPLLAGQMDGNIWLLDSDERWKYYSNS
jgi:hypothetical protein